MLIRLRAIRNFDARSVEDDTPLDTWVNTRCLAAVEETGRLGYRVTLLGGASLIVWENGETIAKLMRESDNFWTKYEVPI